MKKNKPTRYRRSPTGHSATYTLGKSAITATQYREPQLENCGQSGISIGLSFYKPTCGSTIQQNKIMPTATTKRFRGKIVTSVVLSQENAWALYNALHEMFYEEPLELED